MTCCAHCPRPADIRFGDADGPRDMCLQCFSALLFGIVKHDVPGTWLVTTPPQPIMAGVS